jgi:hypothetical protein
MAAFLTSWKMAIHHNFFMNRYLQKIFTCYKVARWPFLFRVKRTDIRMLPVLFNPPSPLRLTRGRSHETSVLAKSRNSHEFRYGRIPPALEY